MRSSFCTIALPARFLLTVALCMATGFLGAGTPTSSSETQAAAHDDNVVGNASSHEALAEEALELADDSASPTPRIRPRPDFAKDRSRCPSPARFRSRTTRRGTS